MNEDIHDSLETIYDYFDRFCKENACFYDIVCDEADMQGYVLKDVSKTNQLYEYIIPIAQQLGVHVNLDADRKDGSLFTFTLESIADGHWRPLTSKRQSKSIFASPKDAEKVRKGQTLAHQGKGPKMVFEQQLDYILEDNRPPTVAVDLDGTLAKHYDKYDKNSIPSPRPGAKKALEKLKEKGVRIIIYTVRGDSDLVKDWCDEHQIPYDHVNENPDQPADSSSKMYADVYIDDRAQDGSGSWNKILSSVTKRLELKEDQYKYPHRKRHRKFSAFRSSFGKSRTFGGATESVGTGAVAGASIPPMLEPSTNIGQVGGVRTHGDGESRKVQSYKTRKDLTDVPTKLRDSDKGVKLQPLVTPKEAQQDLEFEESLNSRLSDIVERTLPTSKVGRPSDDSARTLDTDKNVPRAKPRRGQRYRARSKGEPAQTGSIFMTAEQDQDVVDDDEATRDREDPYAALGKEVNLRPLGLFGPADLRQPSGGTPYQQRLSSNVRVQHPPDRSFDANSPNIAVGKPMVRNPNSDKAYRGRDPLSRDYEGSDKLLDDFMQALDDVLEESVVRPEDGYGFMQRLVNELGLATEARKIRSLDNIYVKACDGNIRLEVRDHSDGYADGDNSLLKVFKDNKLVREISLDLQDQMCVEKTANEVRQIL